MNAMQRKTKKRKEKVNPYIVVAAIAGLTIIECMAMAKGINGLTRSIIIAAIAGLAGWTMPQLNIKNG